MSNIKKVLVSFVGGRPLPNIQQVLSLKPDILHLVVSKDSMQPGGNHEKLLNALPKSLITHSHEVAPYVIRDTEDICRKILAQHSRDEVTFHLSSEPTTMSLAAYRVAQKAGKALFYSSRDGVVDIFQETEPKPVTINLLDYFRVYGWQPTLKQEADKKQVEVAKWMVESVTELNPLLTKIWQKNPKPGELTDLELQDNFYSMLEKFAHYSIINLSKRNDKIAQFLIPKITHNFLKGIWLEIYVYSIASELNIFNECAWDISDHNQQGQLDFSGIFSGQLVIASCKAVSRKITRDPLDELVTRGEQLGHGMCTKIFVTSFIPDKPQSDQIEKWCSEMKIVPVMGSKLGNLGDILTREVQNPSYKRI